jgi:hypothetical protein
MQVRAILEAAGELLKAGKKAYPEIMIPVTCNLTEIQDQKATLGSTVAFEIPTPTNWEGAGRLRIR